MLQVLLYAYMQDNIYQQDSLQRSLKSSVIFRRGTMSVKCIVDIPEQKKKNTEKL